MIIPNPILNSRENDLIEKISHDYKKFTKPGPVSKSFKKVGNTINRVVPESIKGKINDSSKYLSELEIFQKAVEVAGLGFNELCKQANRLTLSTENILIQLDKKGIQVNEYEHLCLLRSYQLERIANRKFGNYSAAFIEGFSTGAPGFPGIPFNIALSFFLYFRATQSIALWYGYDVTNDPREMEIASEVSIMSLAPNPEIATSTVGGHLSKMMVATNLTVLSESLKRLSYEEMAKRGGVELFYVQIRALANKAADKALKKAGQDGIEAGVFRKLLQQLGKSMPKKAGQRAVPILGGVIGAFVDLYYMSRVVRGANLIYHKRFLFEKEKRIEIVKNDIGTE